MSADPHDALAAVLDQLAAHRDRVQRLDEREVGHHAAISERLGQIAELITGIRETLAGHHTVLDQLTGPGRQTNDAALPPDDPDGGAGDDGYRPSPTPRWWKLTTAEREERITRLRAWVEQVYRPGYGHLATAPGPCWESHDLCLYTLDLLAELWSVLYLRPTRSPALLSAQAEYQARILPALAGQLQAETSRCGHAQARHHANGGHGRSTR